MLSPFFPGRHYSTWFETFLARISLSAPPKLYQKLIETVSSRGFEIACAAGSLNFMKSSTGVRLLVMANLLVLPAPALLSSTFIFWIVSYCYDDSISNLSHSNPTLYKF